MLAQSCNANVLLIVLYQKPSVKTIKLELNRFSCLTRNPVKAGQPELNTNTVLRSAPQHKLQQVLFCISNDSQNFKLPLRAVNSFRLKTDVGLYAAVSNERNTLYSSVIYISAVSG